MERGIAAAGVRSARASTHGRKSRRGLFWRRTRTVACGGAALLCRFAELHDLAPNDLARSAQTSPGIITPIIRVTA